MTPEERFEKWWQTVPVEYTDVVNEDVARSSYLAATEDAARIAEEYYSKHLCDEETCCDIAAAIKGE